MKRLLPLGIGLLLALSACKKEPAPVAVVKSGFDGVDCKSMFTDYKYQSQKLGELKTAYLDAWKAFRTEKSLEPDPFAAAPTEGNGLRLADPTPTTDAPPSKLEEIALGLPDALIKHPKFADNQNKCFDLYKTEFQNEVLYDKCVEFFSTLTKTNGIVTAYNAEARRDCREGGYDKRTVPQLYSYCDAPCTFSSTVDCTRCDVSYKNALGQAGNEPLVCLGTYGATEAGNAFCAKMGEHNFKDCRVQNCVTKKGADFAGEEKGQRIAGSDLKIDEKAISAFAQVEGSATMNAGVYADAQVAVRGTLGGSIVMKQMNAGDSILTESGFCRPDSKFVCEVRVRQMYGASASVAGGVGGSFKVFGNGVDAHAALRVGGDLNWSIDSTRSSEAVSCSGLSKNLMFDQCYAFLVTWAKTDLSSQFEGIRDQLKSAIDKVIEAQVSKREAERMDEQRKADACYESGKSGGDKVYSDLKTAFYYGGCHKDGNGTWGVSGEGQTQCINDSKVQCTYGGRWLDGCMDQLGVKCRG